MVKKYPIKVFHIKTFSMMALTVQLLRLINHKYKNLYFSGLTLCNK